jgi:hypothetical protein
LPLNSSSYVVMHCSTLPLHSMFVASSTTHSWCQPISHNKQAKFLTQTQKSSPSSHRLHEESWWPLKTKTKTLKRNRVHMRHIQLTSCPITVRPQNPLSPSVIC